MANIEASVITWLNSILTDGWVAYGDKPETIPDKYILVDRTGGPREAMVLDRAEILIEVYHKDSRSAASDQADVIANAVPSLQATADDITKSKVNSVVHLDDTLTQYHRYQVYCDVYNRQ